MFYAVFSNIKVDGGYKPDFEKFENFIKSWEVISKDDKKQLFEILKELKKHDLTFIFKYGAFKKMACGHWEFFQLPFAEHIVDLNGRCSRCICGYIPAGRQI